MAKDPTSLVEVERQIQLLRDAKVSKNKFLTVGIIAIVGGLLVAIGFSLDSVNVFTVLGALLAGAGVLNVIAAFWKPANVARRIAHLESLAESMEEQSVSSSGGASGTERDATLDGETRRCPYCAEDIQAAAIVCRYCGRDLRSKQGWSAATREQAQLELQAPSNPENGFGTAALVVGLVGLFLPVPFVAPVIALILGFIGDYKVRTFRATNKGMAVAGTWLGVVGTLSWFIIIFYFFVL